MSCPCAYFPADPDSWIQLFHHAATLEVVDEIADGYSSVDTTRTLPSDAIQELANTWY